MQAACVGRVKRAHLGALSEHSSTESGKLY